MNIIIPMAGLGSRFTKYGFSTNKYLLPVNLEKTKMIEKAILTLNIPQDNHKTRFIFILREENGEDTELRNYLRNLCKIHSYSCVILSTQHLTEGPACTAYLAKEYVDNEIPLIISNSDQILDWSYENFINTSNNYDASVLTYIPDYELIIGNKDKHSFVKFDELTKKPIQFIEKTVISNEALVGVHYYKKGSYFVQSAKYIFNNNIRAPNGEFYLSYTYQALIDMGYSIGTYCLQENEIFYPVGEPDDYFSYYNKTALFFSTPLSNYNIINNYDFFKIFSNETGDNIVINNSLFFPFSPIHNDDVFLTGKSMNYAFTENIYSLQIPLTDTDFDKREKIDISRYTRGWLIGNFEPSILKTKDFEIGILQHKKNEKWGFHFHEETKEINILIKGKIIINNVLVEENTIFIFEKNMISCPLFLEDCIVICIKTPSLPNDKIII
jgi:dTDP-glucose pyrophosphorylase